VLFRSNPDSTQARRALGRIDTLIYLATKPNTGHFHGLGARQTLLLPVFNRFETPHRTTVESGNNWVRLNEPGSTHLRGGQLISEVAFLAELAHRLLGDDPIDWRRLQDPVYVRELIARTVPGYQAIADIDTTHREFEVAGRVFDAPRFATPNGRAQLAVGIRVKKHQPAARALAGAAAAITRQAQRNRLRPRERLGARVAQVVHQRLRLGAQRPALEQAAPRGQGQGRQRQGHGSDHHQLEQGKAPGLSHRTCAPQQVQVVGHVRPC
jgi:hypothetical protein